MDVLRVLRCHLSPSETGRPAVTPGLHLQVRSLTTSSWRRRRSSYGWCGRGLHDARTRTSSPTRQPAPPPPTPHAHATGVAAALRPGKADEALLFRQSVELGHPLASELCGPATRQHHGLPSL